MGAQWFETGMQNLSDSLSSQGKLCLISFSIRTRESFVCKIPRFFSYKLKKGR
jgi:hypothetical protein